MNKLWISTILGMMPAIAWANPRVGVEVHVDINDSYDTVAPGDPVASVDVFYDQLAPYGYWVDEPDVGRVFVPDEASFVPYTNGHWVNTSVGFVWVSSEPHAWATTHYGRWAFSRSYARWYWLPDTQWGPSWVEWRETGAELGWAPMAPDVVIRAGWQAPIESWHYCPAERVLEPEVTRYYVPRERVVVIQREAKPIEHYSVINSARVVVGPPAATLRAHHVTATRVKVEPRTVGRWTPTEAHAQVAHAEEHKATFEVQNQHRIDANANVRAAHTKVVETHPQIKAQVTARVAPKVEPKRPEPARTEHVAPKVEPKVETKRPVSPKIEPKIEPKRPEPTRTEHVAPKVEPKQPAPAPKPVEHAPVKPVAPPARVEHTPPVPKHEQPAPKPAQPAPKHEQPTPKHETPAPAKKKDDAQR